jgi:hypothetical protein
LISSSIFSIFFVWSSETCTQSLLLSFISSSNFWISFGGCGSMF